MFVLEPLKSLLLFQYSLVYYWLLTYKGITWPYLDGKQTTYCLKGKMEEKLHQNNHHNKFLLRIFR